MPGQINKDDLVVKAAAPARDKKVKSWLKTAARSVQKLPPKRAAGRTSGRGRKP